MTPRYHWEVFPHDREVPEHLVQELLGILVHAGVGALELVHNIAWPHEQPRLYDFSRLNRNLFGRGPQQTPRLREEHHIGWWKLRVLCLRSR